MSAHVCRAGDCGLLHDGCARCAEQADDPRMLDGEKLRKAWRKMLAVEFGPAVAYGDAFAEWETVMYASATEAALGRNLYVMAVLLTRLGVDPTRVGEGGG